VPSRDWQQLSFHHRDPDLDLGDDHYLWYYGWAPDRDLNPQYAEFPDVEKAGASVGHLRPDGSYCEGAITFDVGPMSQLRLQKALWQVQSWEPLTVSPSLLCRAPVFDPDRYRIAGSECGDHGFIRAGRWVRA
jgi:hypothetical protein